MICALDPRLRVGRYGNGQKRARTRGTGSTAADPPLDGRHYPLSSDADEGLNASPISSVLPTRSSALACLCLAI